MYAKSTHIVHWELCDTSAKAGEVERVAAAAAKKMKKGDVVIWDRLDRNEVGDVRIQLPNNYSPKAKESFKAKGVKLLFLPPKGKYFDPVELLFNDLKSHYIRPAFPRNGEKLTKDKTKRSSSGVWLSGPPIPYLASSRAVLTAIVL